MKKIIAGIGIGLGVCAPTLLLHSSENIRQGFDIEHARDNLQPGQTLNMNDPNLTVDEAIRESFEKGIAAGVGGLVLEIALPFAIVGLTRRPQLAPAPPQGSTSA